MGSNFSLAQSMQEARAYQAARKMAVALISPPAPAFPISRRLRHLLPLPSKYGLSASAGVCFWLKWCRRFSFSRNEP